MEPELNYLLLSAGILSIVVGLVHSVLGELLIFKKLRNGSLVPAASASPLRESSVRIIWATWHLASVFGFAMGAMLLHFAVRQAPTDFIVHTIATSMLLGSSLVLYATRGKHPGWVGLLCVAGLCWLA